MPAGAQSTPVIRARDQWSGTNRRRCRVHRNLSTIGPNRGIEHRPTSGEHPVHACLCAGHASGVHRLCPQQCVSIRNPARPDASRQDDRLRGDDGRSVPPVRDIDALPRWPRTGAHDPANVEFGCPRPARRTCRRHRCTLWSRRRCCSSPTAGNRTFSGSPRSRWRPSEAAGHWAAIEWSMASICSPRDHARPRPAGPRNSARRTAKAAFGFPAAVGAGHCPCATGSRRWVRSSSAPTTSRRRRRRSGTHLEPIPRMRWQLRPFGRRAAHPSQHLALPARAHPRPHRLRPARCRHPLRSASRTRAWRFLSLVALPT